jgi:sigma-E factor negative regulatory protein RseA
MVMNNVSALMDGELDQGEAEREITRLRQDPVLRETWEAFHLIGDALRGERFLSAGFSERLTARLEQEPTVLAPRKTPRKRVTTYALSAAASVAAAALVAWVALSTNNPLSPSGEIARAPATLAAPQFANLPDDGKMNEYLLAHQGVSPSTELQGVAPYVRTVTPVSMQRR